MACVSRIAEVGRCHVAGTNEQPYVAEIGITSTVTSFQKWSDHYSVFTSTLFTDLGSY